MLLVHVVHCSPEIVGNADSICSLRAGISTGIIVGATSLLAVWVSDDLSARGLVQGCRRPVRPARSACQAGHLAWPGRPDRDLTGRQAGIHPLIIINY